MRMTYGQTGDVQFPARRHARLALIVSLTATLAAAMQRIGARPEYRTRLADLGFDGFVSTPQELQRFVIEQIAAWGEMIRGAGIEPE